MLPPAGPVGFRVPPPFRIRVLSVVLMFALILAVNWYLLVLLEPSVKLTVPGKRSGLTLPALLLTLDCSRTLW